MNERENRRRKYIPLRRTSSLAWSPFCINLSLSISIESLTSGMSLANDMFETRPSLRPVGTSYAGPFACVMTQWHNDTTENKLKKDLEGFHFSKSVFITKDIASRAAKATMSAHETTPGHAASTSALTDSIISNPLTPSCPNANFSEIAPLSTRMDPSHPWKRVLKLLKISSDRGEHRQLKKSCFVPRQSNRGNGGVEVWLGG